MSSEPRASRKVRTGVVVSLLIIINDMNAEDNNE